MRIIDMPERTVLAPLALAGAPRVHDRVAT
jgi:hypothetical protein